jgi:hypothetical protein
VRRDWDAASRVRVGPALLVAAVEGVSRCA